MQGALSGVFLRRCKSPRARELSMVCLVAAAKLAELLGQVAGGIGAKSA